MINSKNLHIVKLLITALLGLTLILSLFFNIYYVSALGMTEGESGFKFLTFSTELSSVNQALSICCSVVCLLQLLYGICCLGLCFYYAFVSKSEKMDSILNKVNLGAFVLLMLFASAGIITKIYVSGNIKEFVPDIDSSVDLKVVQSWIHTSSFFGLIIGCVLYIVSIVVSELDKKGVLARQTDSVHTGAVVVKNQKPIESHESNEIDLLEKYFELYEKGVLTQEEFQEKKQNILKNQN